MTYEGWRMTYTVKEIFYSIQGEGYNTGKPAHFIRFSGCNLDCAFCDTDFDGVSETGGKFVTAQDLVDEVSSRYNRMCKLVVLTGGEPGLQVDAKLIKEFKRQGYKLAIETNGTVELPRGIDWITLSPKAGCEIVERDVNEIKIVYPPQNGIKPENFSRGYTNYFVQPLDNEPKHIEDCCQFCIDNPRWRVSLQTHKIMGVP